MNIIVTSIFTQGHTEEPAWEKAEQCAATPAVRGGQPAS